MKLYDLAKMAASGVPGTGVITLAAAVYGFLTFAQAGAQDGELLTCGFLDGPNCMVARCVYSATGPTLTVQRVLRSSGAGNTGQISLTSSAIAFITVTSADLNPTGLLGYTLASTAPDGWLLCDDGTIGNAASAASNRANDDTHDLFALLYAGSDANFPLLTSTGTATTRSAQGTAAQAWAANCRLTLPRLKGRALGVAGSGAGLTSRNIGDLVGEERHTLSSSEQASMPVGSMSVGGSFSGSISGSSDTPITQGTGNTPGSYLTASANGDEGEVGYVGSVSGSASGSISGSTSGGTASGGGGSHNLMQPTVFVNVMVKL